MTDEYTERRSNPRTPVDLDLQIALKGDLVRARVRDISTSGIRCVTECEVPIMTQVQMVILLPLGLGGTRSLSCSGAVVRSEPPDVAATPDDVFETAIFFTELRESDRAALETFISTAHRRPSAN